MEAAGALVQVDHPVQGEHCPLGGSAAMLRAGIQMRLLPAGQCSRCSSCPLSLGPGRSGALGKLLEFRAMIIPFQYPVRDQRDSSDLTWWGGPSTPGGVTWALLGGLVQVTTTPPTPSEEGEDKTEGSGEEKQVGQVSTGPSHNYPRKLSRLPFSTFLPRLLHL